MSGPTCLLAFYVGRAFDRFRGASWRVALAGGGEPAMDICRGALLGLSGVV
jgi:hypothetical protein